MRKKLFRTKRKTQNDKHYKHINIIIFLQQVFDEEKVDFQSVEDFVFGTNSMFYLNFFIMFLMQINCKL